MKLLAKLDEGSYKELVETVKEKGNKYLKTMTTRYDMIMGMMAMNNQMASVNKSMSNDKKKYSALQKKN